MKTEPIIVRGSAGVWLSSYKTEHEAAASIIEGIASGRRHFTEASFIKPDKDFSVGSDPWLKIGTAEIVVTLTPPDSMAADEIRALQARLEAMRAEHHLAQQALLDRISKLSAITHQPNTVEA